MAGYYPTDTNYLDPTGGQLAAQYATTQMQADKLGYLQTGTQETSGGIAGKAWAGLGQPPSQHGGCPNCGYCPHCGRSNTTLPPYYPYMPNYGQITCESGTSQLQSGQAVH